MFLKHISLQSYKQHTSLEADIEGNVIIVVGPNGRGKSNLLGAFNFALSGEQPGSSREDLLQWGAAHGHVALDLECEGTEGRIVRNLHDTKATFDFGTDSYNGITKVANGLTTHLGWDKDLGRQAVFVRQAKLDSILFAEARERELTFQRLMGIQYASKVHKNMGTLLATWSTPPNYDEQIADGRTRLDELRTRLKTLTDESTQAEAQRNVCPDITELQGRLNTLAGLHTTLTRLSAVTTQLNSYNTKIPGIEVKLATLKIPDVDLTMLDEEITRLRKLGSDAARYKQVLSDWERCGREIMELGKEPCTEEQLTKLEQEARELATAYNESQGRLKMYTDLVQSLNNPIANAALAVCPLCGHSIEDANTLCERLGGIVSDMQMEAAQNDPTSKQQAYSQLQQAAQSYTSRRAALLQNYKNAEAIMNSTPHSDADPAALEQQAAQMAQDRTAVLCKITEKTELDAQLRNDKEQQTLLISEYDQLHTLLKQQSMPQILEMLNTAGVPSALAKAQEDTATLQQTINDIQLLDQHVAKLKGMVEELTGSVDTLEKTLATLEYKRSQQSERADAIATLTRVRDWFHYANGPHTMAMSVLADMTRDVNDFLGQFAAPYTVYPSDDGFGYKYIKHDGSPMPPTPPDTIHLSGGERVQLAISYRFASYCMFANKLGLLSLDEPTVYLDERNIGRFCVVMEQIKKVAQSMNLQVMIATHERSLIPFADTVIDLGDEA